MTFHSTVTIQSVRFGQPALITMRLTVSSRQQEARIPTFAAAASFDNRKKSERQSANGMRTKKEPRDGHITGLLHRSMAKAEETSSDPLTNTDSRMQMQ
jgi:hypothetical protein